MKILYCKRCKEQIEVYYDGSNVMAVVDWIFKHKLHILEIDRIDN